MLDLLVLLVSEAILPQQVRLPHVLPLWEPIWNLDLTEIFDALL